MESAILPCLISSWEELDSSMVELLWFIQASITLGGNDINQAPWIKKRTITESYCKIGKKMAYLFFFYFFILLIISEYSEFQNYLQNK